MTNLILLIMRTVNYTGFFITTVLLSKKQYIILR